MGDTFIWCPSAESKLLIFCDLHSQSQTFKGNLLTSQDEWEVWRRIEAYPNLLFTSFSWQLVPTPCVGDICVGSSCRKRKESFTARCASTPVRKAALGHETQDEKFASLNSSDSFFDMTELRLPCSKRHDFEKTKDRCAMPTRARARGCR